MKGCILAGGHGLSALGSRYEGGRRRQPIGPLEDGTGGMKAATAIAASAAASTEVQEVESEEPRPLLNEPPRFRLE